MAKHQFALLGGVPSEQADVREEGVCFFVDRDPRVGPRVDPDVQGPPVGHESHAAGGVPTPAH